MEDKYVKILFELNPDKDGYPPNKFESLWAKVINDGVYQVDNIPFFVKGLSESDLVAAEKKNGELMFSKVLNKSGNTTIRVLPYKKEDIKDIREKLSTFGCDTELMGDYGLISVSVPSNADYEAISKYLLEAENRGLLGYEESALRH